MNQINSATSEPDQQGILKPLYYASPRGQCAVMLLAALHDLYIQDGLRNVTKRQAIKLISRKHWFALKPEDQEPYPSQHATTGETRWHTLIAWARKDSVLRDLVSYEAHDAWGLTRLGRDTFEKILQLSQTFRQPVAPCFLWSKEFRWFMCSGYTPAAGDPTRPRFFYRDIWPPDQRWRSLAENLLRDGTWQNFIAKYRGLVGKDPGNWAPTRNADHNVDYLARLITEYMDEVASRAL